MTSRAIPAEHCRTRRKKGDSNCNLRNSCVIVLLSYRWLFFTQSSSYRAWWKQGIMGRDKTVTLNLPIGPAQY